jgi:hypothetical protein
LKKSDSKFIKRIKTVIPADMEYCPIINNAKDKDKFIKRCEKIIRSSQEYRDYISFLKDHVDMDRCAFFQSVSSKESKRVKIEIHHEPFTLYDYVAVVVDKYQSEGLPLNDLCIADEVMELHYNNKVGLIPLSKTIHQMIHNSNKLVIPLNMVYGDYASFLSSSEYEPYVEDLYDKLESKINMTKNLTAESFDALAKEFTYIEMEDVPAVEKQETKSSTSAA